MMLANRIMLVAVLAAIVLSTGTEAATTSAVKLCGRKLSDIMSRVCHVYNSPSWNDPTVVEQPAAVVRRKRQIGIADQCCTFGCTWEQLNEYCAISTNSESPMGKLEAHLIADRSVKADEADVAAPEPTHLEPASKHREELRNAARAAPVVGTVSPLLTWGRTLNTDLPPVEQDRYAYIAVYS